ncbi:MAG: hypothetical protein OXC40_03425, partial [Proteobacteria bacterium]|nr:hypothetical protein [Pseudomonadota bacterium]
MQVRFIHTLITAALTSIMVMVVFQPSSSAQEETTGNQENLELLAISGYGYTPYLSKVSSSTTESIFSLLINNFTLYQLVEKHTAVDFFDETLVRAFAPKFLIYYAQPGEKNPVIYELRLGSKKAAQTLDQLHNLPSEGVTITPDSSAEVLRFIKVLQSIYFNRWHSPPDNYSVKDLEEAEKSLLPSTTNKPDNREQSEANQDQQTTDNNEEESPTETTVSTNTNDDDPYFEEEDLSDLDLENEKEENTEDQPVTLDNTESGMVIIKF